MDSILNNWCIQIDVTTLCKNHCIYCSRHLGHVPGKKRYAMTPEMFEKALDSLEGWPNVIGVMGGEPLLHPQFREIVEIAAARVPREKLAIWTSGLPSTSLDDPRSDSQLDAAFGYIYYNRHDSNQSEVCRHQPLTVAVEEVAPDAAMMWKLINNCWLPRLWCPVISPAGAYFCEVAGALDAVLYNGVHAWPLERDWWKRPPESFREQVEKLCPRCGMCIPMERQHLIDTQEKFSPRLLEDFRQSGCIRLEQGKHIEIFNGSFSRADLAAAAETWMPSNYRDDLDADEKRLRWEKGVLGSLTPDLDAPDILHLETEESFELALAHVNTLSHGEEPRSFRFWHHGLDFDPLKEPYPFVLPGREMENRLYYRAMLLHFRQVMNDADFAALRSKPLTPELLKSLGQKYRDLLEKRKEQVVIAIARKLEGQEAYFWGYGVAWQRYGKYFKNVKARCFVADLGTGHERDLRVDNINIRHPQSLMEQGAAPLPSVVFCRRGYADEWTEKILSNYSSLVQGQLYLVTL